MDLKMALDGLTDDEFLEFLDGIGEDGFEFHAAALTRNGSGSLIMTVPQDIWKPAGVDHGDPGSVSMFHSEEHSMVVMRLG